MRWQEMAAGLFENSSLFAIAHVYRLFHSGRGSTFPVGCIELVTRAGRLKISIVEWIDAASNHAVRWSPLVDTGGFQKRLDILIGELF